MRSETTFDHYVHDYVMNSKAEFMQLAMERAELRLSLDCNLSSF